MYITSRQNDEVLQTQYTVTDDINGVPTIETDYLQLQKYHETPIKMMSQAFIDNYVLVLRDETAVGDDSLLKLTGVHQFIYDMNMSRVYEEYTQYFSIENILDVVFADSNYTYEVKGDKTYYSLMFENFGDKDKMSLIQQICGRWEVEYHIDGTHITFGDRRGINTSEVFRYKMNILDANVNLDISKAATYILGKFGKKAEEEDDIDTYVEKEFLHPLAEQYGRLDADPYSNENITVESTMNEYMKRKIEETWILSIELDVTDLIGKGKVNVGDTVWAIDERMNIEIQTRIIKVIRYYDINDEVYRTKITLGNYNYIDSVSNTEQEAETLPERIENTNRRLQELHAQWENDFNQNRDDLIGRIEDGFEKQKQEVDADLDAWKRVEEDIRRGISDSVNNVIGNMDSMETAVGEWQDTAAGRFNTIETGLLKKLESGDLEPLESRLTANEDGISGLFTKVEGLNTKENLVINSIGESDYSESSTRDFILSESTKGKTMLSFDLTMENYDVSDKAFHLTINFIVKNAAGHSLPIIAVRQHETQRVFAEVDVTDVIGFNISSRVFTPSNGIIENVKLERLDEGQTEPSPYSVSPIEVPNSITALFSQIELNAETLDLIFGKVEGNERAMANYQFTVDGLSSTVSTFKGDLDDLTAWRSDKGSLFEQTALGFDQRVWQQDIDALQYGVENLIPNSDIENWKSAVVPDEWRNAWGAGYVFGGRQNSKYLLVRSNNEVVNDGATYGVQTPILSKPVVAGEEYTLAFNNFDYGSFPYDYLYLMNVDGEDNQRIDVPVHEKFVEKWTDSNSSKNVERMIAKVIPNFSGRARILFAKYIDVGQETMFYLNEPMFVKGNKAPMSFSSSSADFMQHTDFVLRSDGFFLGGKYVGGEHYSTAIVGDATGLKLIGDNIDIDGNVNVLGKIRSESISSVYANISEVRTRILTANSVKTDMLQVNEAMIREFFATTGRIRELTSRTAFINEIQAINITAEQIRLGFNNVGNNLQLTNNGLGTYSNGTLTSRLYSAGQEFFRGGYRVGKIGTASWYGHPNHRGLSFQLDSNADYFSFGLEEDIEDVYSAKLMWHKNSDATAKGFTMNDDVGIANDLTVRGAGGIYANRDVNALNVEARSALKAGSRARVQSSGNGARLYASDNVWLYVNEDGQVGISVNGNAHAIITV